MANFEPAYNLVAAAEGGYQAHPNDTGNYNSLGQLVGTNWGISAPVYETWIGRPPTADDMRDMTKAEAKQIYRSNFWNKIQGDKINDQPVANIFFDGVVNHGRTGIMIMQQVLGLPADGIAGPVTITEINRRPPEQTYIQYREARRQFYRDLVSRKPALSVFLDGWINRIEKFQDYAGGGLAAGAVIVLALAWYLITK